MNMPELNDNVYSLDVGDDDKVRIHVLTDGSATAKASWMFPNITKDQL